MTAFYKELQPADAFKIRLPYPFSDYDRQLLTLLSISRWSALMLFRFTLRFGQKGKWRGTKRRIIR